MSDLISRDDAIRELNGACSSWEDDAKVQEIVMAIPSAKPTGDLISRADAIDCCECHGSQECKDRIKALPSAEAVQGEWIDIDYYYRMATCSHCHKVTMFEKWGEYTEPYNFCPNCGAIMKGGGE